MGAITPIGIGIKESFENLVKGVTGTVSLNKQNYYDLRCLVGAPMPPSVYTEDFHNQHKMQMDDRFYSIANCIIKEAMQ
jgi:hypothetical protein